MIPSRAAVIAAVLLGAAALVAGPAVARTDRGGGEPPEVRSARRSRSR